MKRDFYVVCDAMGEPVKSDAISTLNEAQSLLNQAKHKFPEYEFWVMECWETPVGNTGVEIHEPKVWN